ncbi:hypothetical protein HMPREF1146_0022 [Prevotella sp. MSX73]|nr:hypothetical protein HMPREF1146_0022 [Prevotella sp. MSX73]
MSWCKYKNYFLLLPQEIGKITNWNNFGQCRLIRRRIFRGGERSG